MAGKIRIALHFLWSTVPRPNLSETSVSIVPRRRQRASRPNTFQLFFFFLLSKRSIKISPWNSIDHRAPCDSMNELRSLITSIFDLSFFFLIKRRINYTIDRFNVKVRARIKSSKLKYRFFLQKNRRVQTETELQVTKLRVYIIWSNQSDMIKEPCWWEKEETLSPSSPPRCL